MKAVDRFLAKGGGVLIGGDGTLDDDIPSTYAAFEEMCDKAEMERLDGVLGKKATDDACERWTPVVRAAYYFGLAMGLKMGHHPDR